MTDLELMTVVGTRPQFIKASTVSRVLRKISGISEFMLHTGQHFDESLSGVFFDELEIPPPRCNLGIAGGSHGQMTGRMLEGIERVLLKTRPAAVLVYGDTNSTLAGALAAAKLHIPVVHVEAGLRSFNNKMPEEHNRRITDHISNLLFCPTETAVRNLMAEGISSDVHYVGDVMYDLAIHTAREAATSENSILERFSLNRNEFSVATIHREENITDVTVLGEILAYLKAMAREQHIVIILHPRTRKMLDHYELSCEPLILSPPVSYREMSYLIRSASHVYTDSGGLQKEACFHRTPCTTLRSETEWPETIESGWNRLWKQPAFLPRRSITGFGDGNAADKIVATLCSYLSDG